MSEWRKWASVELVTDPERLLESPSYMSTVMLHETSRRQARVLILEDADYLVERFGTRSSAVSRLLQLGDGLLGDSQNVMFLITTNAPPQDLDKALTRPGRCLATIPFVPFSMEEAQERLAGFDKRATGPMTLAEVYRAKGDVVQITAEVKVPTARGQYL
jgi:SpoVK/Ycf46/Vps4 family AAA+-type ATPase